MDFKIMIKAVLVFTFCILLPINVYADTVYFDTTDQGVTTPMTEWGIEVAWINSDNIRHSKSHMGENEIDLVFTNFWPKYALDGSGNLSASAKADIDNQIAAASSLPNALWGLGVDITGTDVYYFSPSGFNAQRWHDLISASRDYYESASGKTVPYVMPFNEADYWGGTQGTPSDLNDVAQLLANNPNFNGVGIMGPSTLSSGVAWNDYNAAKGPLTHGTTHQLQNWASGDTTADFYQYVASQGDIPFAPELHSLGEAIFSAEYGCQGGAWWGAVMRSRGLFVRSCQGDRLGYAENRPNSSAAAVYRAPDGEVYGFAGGFERHGIQTHYRYVCTNRDVYFNGIGPMREYVLPVNVNQDAYMNIDYDTDILPALDGSRWKIINRQTGDVIEVQGGSTSDGADVRGATDADALYQKWDIIRNRDGYYALYNANSGKPMDLYNWSLSNGGNINQWTDYGAANQYWFIDNAGNGYYYIRNMHSNKYMTDSGSTIYQWDHTGNNNQQWQFVLANPVGSGTPTAHYEFEGDVTDSAGSNNGTAFGSPVYSSDQVGQAIDLDGVNDYVELPDNIHNYTDITIATWVNWDGGAAWQRIFDFGMNTNLYMFLTPSASDGTMRFAITTGSNSAEDALITDALPVGQWVHVAVTLCGNTGILYLNGMPKVAGYIGYNPSDVIEVGTQNNYIGQSQWPDPLFDGRIDDFRIYDYALSATEISNLAGGSGDTTPPAAPTGLVATAGDGSVSLDWADNTEPDLMHYDIYRSTTSGSGYVSIYSGQVTSDYVDNSVTNGTTYYYVVTAVDTSSNESGDSNEASATPDVGIPVDHYADGEITISGTVSGSYVDTTASNDVYEAITEIESGGKPSDRHSLVEHTWTINIGSGDNPVLYVEAYHTANSEGDDFVFGYSTDNVNFTDVIMVTKTSDDDIAQGAALPAGLTGTVYIRVTDTDSTQGNNALDTIYVDELYIKTTSSGSNNPPAFDSDPIVEVNGIEDQPYSSTLANDASDLDSDPLTFAMVPGSGPAWLTVAANGALTGSPSNSDVGLNSWTVSVSDGVAPAVEATLNITVNNTNDVPTFTVDPINKPNATAYVAYSDTIAGSATDVDAGDTLTYSKLAGGPAWLSVAPGGALSGTPSNSDVGPNNWTVQVSDGNGGTATAVLNITVDAHPLPPVDIDGSGKVDMGDLQRLSQEWQSIDCYTANMCNGTDLDGSGSIGLEDLLMLAQHWLE